MGRSRRKYKKSKSKIRTGLPKKKYRVIKPAFNIPQKLRCMVGADFFDWDPKAGVINNYRKFGIVSNPNLLTAHSRTPHNMETVSLQALPPLPTVNEFDSPIDGCYFEEEDLRYVMGKKKKDGKPGPIQPLTRMQRVHMMPLIEKYGDNYWGMFMDVKLNKMQHSVACLEELCKRYHADKDEYPLILYKH